MRHPNPTARCAAAVLVAMLGGCIGSPDRVVRIAVGALTGGQAGVFAADEEGFFAAEGLDVELVVFPSSTEAMQALVAGSVRIASGVGGPAFIHAVLAGAPVIGVAELLGTLPHSLIGVPGATRETLAGSRIGIGRFGSNAELSARIALRRLGLDPERDVSLLQLNPQPVRLAALERGEITAAIFSPPASFLAMARGYEEIQDFRRLEIDYPFESMVVWRTVVEDEPDMLASMLRAIVRGTRHFKSRRSEGLRLLKTYTQIDDQDALERTYDYYAEAIQDRPLLTKAGVRRLLDEIERQNPGTAHPDPTDFIDNRIIDRLDRERLFSEPAGREGAEQASAHLRAWRVASSPPECPPVTFQFDASCR